MVRTVDQRVVCGDVTIEGDDQQILSEQKTRESKRDFRRSSHPDRGGGTENIDGQPELAEELAEEPNAPGRVGGGERQDREAQEKVTDRQVENQIVGDSSFAQMFVEEKSDDHRDVRHDRPESDNGENHAQGHREQRRVPRSVVD